MESSWSATASVPDADDNRTEARCLSCRHPLSNPDSIAAGFGPVCRTRLAARQLYARQDALHRRLAEVRARLGRMDGRALAIVSAALNDALEALDAEGVTP